MTKKISNIPYAEYIENMQMLALAKINIATAHAQTMSVFVKKLSTFFDSIGITHSFYFVPTVGVYFKAPYSLLELQEKLSAYVGTDPLMTIILDTGEIDTIYFSDDNGRDVAMKRIELIATTKVSLTN